LEQKNQKLIKFGFLLLLFFKFFEGAPVFIQGAPVPWYNSTMARPSLVGSYCRDITGRLTMQTSLGLPEDPII